MLSLFVYFSLCDPCGAIVGARINGLEWSQDLMEELQEVLMINSR